MFKDAIDQMKDDAYIDKLMSEIEYKNERIMLLDIDILGYKIAVKKIKERIKSNDERIERLSREPQFYDQTRKIEMLHGEALGLELALKFINESLGEDKDE